MDADTNGALNICSTMISGNVFDLADVVSGRKQISSLTRDEMYHYYKHHFIPKKKQILFSLKVSQKIKTTLCGIMLIGCTIKIGIVYSLQQRTSRLPFQGVHFVR